MRLSTLIVVLIPLLGWWAYGLFDLDEGFYAAVVREMIARGEWITPYYNGSPWFEKPILLYWLAKPCVMVFGDQFGPRLPSILATMLTAWAIVGFSQSKIGADRANRAAMIFGTSLLAVILGRMMMTDGLFMLCLSVALLSLFNARSQGALWLLVSGFSLGVAVLAKGPVALLLYFPILLFSLIYLKGFRGIYFGHFVGSILLCALMIASWYWPAYQQNGQTFVQKFLIEQNLQRFRGGDEAHTLSGFGHYFLFIPLLFLGAFPWTLRLFRAPNTGYGEEDEFKRFAWFWFWMIFLFFSLSGAKLPHYIAPCLVPLALILAMRGPVEDHDKVVWRHGIAAGVLLVIAQAGFMIYYNGIATQWFSLPGLHREVHAVAAYAREKGGEVAAYQLPRRQKALGTGQAKVQETSHPSLAFYLGRPFIGAETPKDLADHRRLKWVITRPNRVSDLKPFHQVGIHLEKVEVDPSITHFELYRVIPASPASSDEAPLKTVPKTGLNRLQF